MLRQLRLISLIAGTWVFFFLYGSVEDALPVYVARDLHAGAGRHGAYWASFGAGALVSAPKEAQYAPEAAQPDRTSPTSQSRPQRDPGCRR